MDRSLLKVRFTKKVVLPEYEPEPEKVQIINPDLKIKLLRLCFFAFIVSSVIYGAMLIVEYSFSMCQGEHRSFGVITKEMHEELNP